ncbi:MAG: glutamine--fructose-6-phosphate transaminase (isomerizing) [Deltaproteobacteria bacterium]|nr:glutamine--fructose-6-phosphate transaminase (isomerizing) [Deltaproteobacteria bacterium]
MCGVIGFSGVTPCVTSIFNGLKRLEYRGYDSSGIAVMADQRISVVKSKGKLNQLEPLLASLPADACVGMGHTRWATHGAPSTENAHPHSDEGISIIHNGILENYKELKIKLLEEGVSFLSETDSEVVVHLLRAELRLVHDVRKALLNVIGKLEGAYALGVMTQHEPGVIYVVKNASPIVLGIGHNENFFASDVLALLPHTNRFIFPEDGELARIVPDGVEVWDFFGKKLDKEIVSLNQEEARADKGGYRHYMLKEIHEQPAVLANTIERLVDLEAGEVRGELTGLCKLDLAAVRKIHIVACGTAFYAGLMGRYQIESFARLPVDCELASEFRYRNPCLDRSTLVIAVTQSGETADTLACIKHAKKAGCQTFALCNVLYSSVPRESDVTLYMEAGPEIGVASTKAFTSMVLNFFLMSLELARLRGVRSPEGMERALEALRILPNQVSSLMSLEARISELAGELFESGHCLFLGRGHFYPVALEGALKLKEISYIHAEGYAAGELKHGPIALIDKNMPVIAIINTCQDFEKTLSNLEEIHAREGQLIVVGQDKDRRLEDLCRYMIPCPVSPEPALQALLNVIPLQMFAYFMALHRGTDVDQPRNLAKSVTVE